MSINENFINVLLLYLWVVHYEKEKHINSSAITITIVKQSK